MRYSKKVICIGVIKVTTFLLIFLILFHGATDLFRTKTFFYSVKPIYNLPKNSVDVLLLGTSHMNCTISPMDLWNEYGLTSFNAAIGEQTIPSTYFELRELLKIQKPKIIVLELYYIFMEDIFKSPEQKLHWFVDNVPFSMGVSEAIQTLIQKDHGKKEYYLNFYSFHNRWKELSKIDFRPSLGYSEYNQGAEATRGAQMTVYSKHYIIKDVTVVPRDEVEPPPDYSLEYLQKIIELCREKEISLVFIAQPFSASNDVQKMMNYIDLVADNEGVPYINFFYLLDEIEFDFATDMAESSHVNYFGVQKLTSYLGEYLRTNYNLEDHRNDPKIADLWNKDYETFAREINNTMMKTAGDLDEYFNYLQNQDYIIAWNAYSETPLSETSLPDYLEGMGIDQTGIKTRKWYCAVTRGDELLYQKSLKERPNDAYMAEDALFSFGSGITESTNPIGVHVGRTEYSVGTKGVNLAVYDPVSRTVVDNVNIDLSTGEIKR